MTQRPTLVDPYKDSGRKNQAWHPQTMLKGTDWPQGPFGQQSAMMDSASVRASTLLGERTTSRTLDFQDFSAANHFGTFSQFKLLTHLEHHIKEVRA